jgi:sigma-B regulation protein RsbU (phosphoserine phosphatase)
MARYFLAGTQDDAPLRFELTPEVQLVGRTTDCDIPVPDAAVSRRHAEVRTENERVYIKDLGSLNGTFINGNPLKGETVISTGDKARFGHVTLTLLEHEATPYTRLSSDDEPSSSATMTTSIHEIRAEATRSRSARILSAVSEAGVMLSKRMEMEDIYESVLDLLEKFIKASRILILEGEPTNGDHSVLASRVDDTAPDEPLRMSKNMLKSIIEEGRSFLTSDAATDDQWDTKQSIVKLGVRAAMGAPLFDNDRILGAMYVDSRTSGLTYQSEDLQLLTLLANMVAVKITNSRLEEEERTLEQLRQELSVVAGSLKNLLPTTIPSLDDYQMFAHQDPCEDIGGDLYDVRAMKDGRVWLVVGDVTGHGIGAALLMSNVMAGLQILEDQCEDPVCLVSQLEAYLGQHVELGQFVTLWAGVLDPATGHIEYVNAGHNPPFVLGKGDTQKLPTTGLPVAILPGGQDRTAKEFVLEKGSTLLVFSDGVSEFTQNEVQYDEGRMQEFLGRVGDEDAETLGKELLRDVEQFGGGQPAADDLTLLVVKRA